MLKNKLKLLLSIIMIICLALSPLSYADDETAPAADKVENTASQEAQNQTNATENTSSVENAQPTDAQTTATPSQQNTVKTGDVYLVGDTVNVDYIIDGNLYVIANELNISSQVVGNVFAMANKVTLQKEGYIGAALYALGTEVNISGVTFDAYVTANSLSIPGYIYRDLHSVSESFKLSGVIGRDASLVAKALNFEKSAEVTQDSQSPEGQCKIMGALNYTSENEAQIPENVVSGKVSYSKPDSDTSVNITNYAMSAITSIVFVLAVWGLFKWLSPKFVENTSKRITTKPFKTIGLGLVGVIGLPIVSVLLLVAGITSSFGIVLLVSYFILIFVSKAVCLIGINDILAKKLKFDGNLKTFALLIVTSAVAWATTLIPVASGLFELVFVVLGMGIIVRSLVSKKDSEKKDNNTEKKESKKNKETK